MQNTYGKEKRRYESGNITSHVHHIIIIIIIIIIN